MRLRIRAKQPRTLLNLELSLWLAGAVAIAYYTIQVSAALRFQAEQARRFDRAVSSFSPKGGRSASNPVQGANQTSRHGKVLGRLQISRLGLSAMVVDGVDDAALRLAVGHIPGTPLPGDFGNVALAGHRDTFFRPLRNIRIADQIDIETWKGDFRYRVTSTAIVSPEDVSVLRPTPDHSLTLVTCYPFNFIGAAPKRFVVWAKSEKL